MARSIIPPGRSMTPAGRTVIAAGGPDRYISAGYGTSFELTEPSLVNQRDEGSTMGGPIVGGRSPSRNGLPEEEFELPVYLERQEGGFGFRIIGGTEEGSQVIVVLGGTTMKS